MVRRLPGALLVGGLVLVILAFGSLLGARLLGYEPLVVRSGSMEGTIHTGSLVFVAQEPAADIAVGDVAVIDPPGAAAPRLHRVIERHRKLDRVMVRTQGDANPTPDADVVVLPSRVPTPVLVIPGLGYLLAALTSQAGMLVVASMVAVIIAGSLLWALWRPATATA